MVYDYCVIGGGIVGLASAMKLLERQPEARLILLEKESGLARHQTGHNSGVIHAGIYYAPGSLKADFCRRGAQATKDFCDQNGIPYETCGKLLVATNALELGGCTPWLHGRNSTASKSIYWMRRR
jgi:L-2-hydroxyglutarate oxidase